MALVGGNTLFAGRSDAGNDKGLVNINPTTNLIHSRPAVLLADEPIGNLDSRTGQNVAGLLKMCTQKFHQTLVMITHNLELAQLADHVLRLEDGRILSVSEN